MSRIGVVPTKTSVQLRTDSGVDTISAATTKQAGAMTADHVAMLEEIYRAHQAGAGSTIEILPPVRSTTPNLPQIAAAIRDGVSHVNGRVAMLEQELALARKLTIPLPDAEAAVRVDALEQRVGLILEAMQEIVGHIEDLQQRAAFIEAHALADVKVETREEGKSG